MAPSRYFTRSKGVGRGFHKFQDPSGQRHRLARFGQATGRKSYTVPVDMRSQVAPMPQEEAPVSFSQPLVADPVVPDEEPFETVIAKRRGTVVATPVVRPYSNPFGEGR